MIKKIHFHADDFGRSKLISKNILKCIKSKNINSISVLVGFDEKFFSYIKKKKINIKLHINLTEGYKNFLINQNYTFFELLFLQLHPNFSQHKNKINFLYQSKVLKSILYLLPLIHLFLFEL